MEIHLTPEREAELAALARRQGKDPSELAGKALEDWLDRERKDYDATVEAVKEGYADVQAGRTRPVKDVFRDLRCRYDLPG